MLKYLQKCCRLAIASDSSSSLVGRVACTKANGGRESAPESSTVSTEFLTATSFSSSEDLVSTEVDPTSTTRGSSSSTESDVATGAGLATGSSIEFDSESSTDSTGMATRTGAGTGVSGLENIMFCMQNIFFGEECLWGNLPPLIATGTTGSTTAPWTAGSAFFEIYVIKMRNFHFIIDVLTYSSEAGQN